MQRALRASAQAVLRSSFTSAASRSEAPDWRPRVVHARGFAPYGCSAARKVHKTEIQAIENTIIGHLDETIASMLQPLPGFALNHNISLRVGRILHQNSCISTRPDPHLQEVQAPPSRNTSLHRDRPGEAASVRALLPHV